MSGQNAHNCALDDRKVRRNSLLRSLERAGGPNVSAKAVESGQKAWLNGKSALLVPVPVLLKASLSIYLAEFLGFARLRPTPGTPSSRPPISPQVFPKQILVVSPRRNFGLVAKRQYRRRQKAPISLENGLVEATGCVLLLFAIYCLAHPSHQQGVVSTKSTMASNLGASARGWAWYSLVPRLP